MARSPKDGKKATSSFLCTPKGVVLTIAVTSLVAALVYMWPSSGGKGPQLPPGVQLPALNQIVPATGHQPLGPGSLEIVTLACHKQVAMPRLSSHRLSTASDPGSTLTSLPPPPTHTQDFDQIKGLVKSLLMHAEKANEFKYTLHIFTDRSYDGFYGYESAMIHHTGQGSWQRGHTHCTYILSLSLSLSLTHTHTHARTHAHTHIHTHDSWCTARSVISPQISVPSSSTIAIATTTAI